jgi:hypothetical protein
MARLYSETGSLYRRLVLQMGKQGLIAGVDGMIYRKLWSDWSHLNAGIMFWWVLQEVFYNNV